MDNAKVQLARQRTQIANLQQKVRHLTTTAQTVVPKRLLREIRVLLHPDRVQDLETKKRTERCLAEFNGLVDED